MCVCVGTNKGRSSKGGTGVHPLDDSAESDYGRARCSAIYSEIESILRVLKGTLDDSVPWQVVVH